MKVYYFRKIAGNKYLCGKQDYDRINDQIKSAIWEIKQFDTDLLKDIIITDGKDQFLKYLHERRIGSPLAIEMLPADQDDQVEEIRRVRVQSPMTPPPIEPSKITPPVRKTVKSSISAVKTPKTNPFKSPLKNKSKPQQKQQEEERTENYSSLLDDDEIDTSSLDDLFKKNDKRTIEDTKQEDDEEIVLQDEQQDEPINKKRRIDHDDNQ